MSKSNKFPIPESIANEVTQLSNAMDDLDREMKYLNDKKRFAHAKMWNLINEKIPEARGVSCNFNSEKMTVTVNAERKSGIPKALLDLIGQSEDEDDDD